MGLKWGCGISTAERVGVAAIRHVLAKFRLLLGT